MVTLNVFCIVKLIVAKGKQQIVTYFWFSDKYYQDFIWMIF